MLPDPTLQRRLRAALTQANECPWLHPAIMAFRYAPGQRHLRMPPTATPHFVSAYLNATLAKCPAYLSDGCVPWSQRSHTGGALPALPRPSS